MKHGHGLSDLNGTLTLSDLEREGLDFKEFVSTVVDDVDACSCLLTGSRAEGHPDASSDLDLLLLVPKGVEVTEPHDTFNPASDRLSEKLWQLDGLKVNLAVAQRDRVSGVLGSMLALAPVFYDPGQIKALPLIDGNDLTFLIQLRSGIVLINDDLAQQWQDEFLVELVPLYLTVKHYLAAGELLEDARGRLEHSESPAKHIYRTAAEYLLLSAVAFAGRPLTSAKSLVQEAEERVQKVNDPALKEALAQGTSYLVDFQGNGPAAVAELTAIQHVLGRALSVDPDIATAIEHWPIL